MSYVKATDILPEEIVEIIQKYVDGEYIYIPRKLDNRREWGENTKSKEYIMSRNRNIYESYLNGKNVQELSVEFFLSVKSIQGIITKVKKQNI